MYGLLLALLSAFLFAASTPASKLLLGSFQPFQLAGLLYLGAAVGMAPVVAFERRRGTRMVLDRTTEAPPSPPPSGIEECWMFDESNVPVGQRYDFFMRCCQHLRYGKSECFRLWVERKPQRAAIDGSAPVRGQKVTSACLPICVLFLEEMARLPSRLATTSRGTPSGERICADRRKGH